MTELIRTLPITHKFGLHARASTRFVELAQSFDSDIGVMRGADLSAPWANGKSVLEILTLGIQLGDDITLRAAGADADRAMEALAELVEADFGGV